MNDIILSKSKSNSNSQPMRILERLEAGEELSVRQIMNQLHINSPTKAISILSKDLGYDIKRKWVKSKNSRYVVYFMEQGK